MRALGLKMLPQHTARCKFCHVAFGRGTASLPARSRSEHKQVRRSARETHGGPISSLQQSSEIPQGCSDRPSPGSAVPEEPCTRNPYQHWWKVAAILFGLTLCSFLQPEHAFAKAAAAASSGNWLKGKSSNLVFLMSSETRSTAPVT